MPLAFLVAGDDSSGLKVIAAPDSPVHAVRGGTVSALEIASLTLAGDDGYRYVYRGVHPRGVDQGAPVESGAILGTLAQGDDAGDLVLTASSDEGAPVDVYGLLLGAPDPNELGYDADGVCVSVDPEGGDRQLVGDAPRRDAATTRSPVDVGSRAPGPDAAEPARGRPTPPAAAPAPPAAAPTPPAPAQSPGRQEWDSSDADAQRRRRAAALVARKPGQRPADRR